MPADPTASAAARDDSALLKEAYDSFQYVGRPSANAHPAHLATIAALMGHEAPDPASARVLDIGCGDGGNIVPIAASLPGSRCVGIDLSPPGIEAGRAFAREAGVDNVELYAADLRDLPAAAGTFDYIVAHGFHSWVPEPVRRAMWETIGARLAPRGVAFVSHNVLPGCHLRRIVWDLLGPHVATIGSPVDRVAEARAMAARMAEAMDLQPGLAGVAAVEFRDIADRPGFSVLHDDLAPVNYPVQLRELAGEAAAQRLAWLGDADLFRHPAPAFGERMNAWLAGVDRMTREHTIDHIRLRRYRESLFVHGAVAFDPAPDPLKLAGMHVAATNASVERHGARRSGGAAPLQTALLDRLVELHPGSLSVDEASDFIAARAGAASPLAQRANALALLLNAAYAGAIVPLARPARMATAPAERPCAFAPARWQASRHEFVVNLRHDGVALVDPVMRALLPKLDGTRDRQALVSELASIAPALRDPRRALDDHLAHFVRLGVLEA